jgi:hypothetical protein
VALIAIAVRLYPRLPQEKRTFHSQHQPGSFAKSSRAILT